MKETLRCKRCGSDNAASQRFCTNCGTALQAPVAETPPSSKPSQPSSPDVQKQIQAGSEPNQRASRILGIPLGFVPRVINLALRWIPRIPFYSRVAPFLGLNELSGIRPVFTLGALAIAGF
ncbi:MAG: zinc ribbon domain-containing protein, partial [Anaerolineales bacterium]|nr:zinc ribbon domain-containing protein [Anaerolineales bacterium]